MNVFISLGIALGDVRTLGSGDTVWVTRHDVLRSDWPRYSEAIMVAVTRGAEVRQVSL